ncbi:zinc carboxypeptidase [Singulisphaera sp. Ch08]|uniref:Zinc carboxypeptidase n=1 Tax=Singulisphaera sp. Ch08 TaxID=3120278 RepID=A0AAU7C6S8_9BACT
MALLRCPSCNSKGEVLGNDPQGRFRCTQCGHRFVADEANATQEYNILADDSPPFLSETAAEPHDLLLELNWRSWVGRLARSRGLSEGELVRRALVDFAKRSGFSEPPPR